MSRWSPPREATPLWHFAWCSEVAQVDPDDQGEMVLPMDNRDLHNDVSAWLQSCIWPCSTPPVLKASSGHINTGNDQCMQAVREAADVISGIATPVSCFERQVPAVDTAFGRRVQDSGAKVEELQRYEWEQMMTSDLEGARLRMQEKMRLRDALDREAACMQAADIEAWCLREVESCWNKALYSSGSKDDTPHLVNDLDASRSLERLSPSRDLGRIILEAFLTCREHEIDMMLETRCLPLHIHERETEAARHFLEDVNNLKPHLIRRYREPLASWLQQKVKQAPQQIAREPHRVSGDLNEIMEAFS